MNIAFQGFPKIPRLNREVIVTEKIDGTNACIVINDDDQLTMHAQSRSRIITTDDDNFGFARWVHDNAEELRKLGPGYHFGEWWGSGIQRGYGLPKDEKRFSLFNVMKWEGLALPVGVSVVPVIATGVGFSVAQEAVEMLRLGGSRAAPGFMKPEGVVAYHTQGHAQFKVTLENDERWKGART